MDKHALAGVADGRARSLGIKNNIRRHVDIRKLVDIYVAVAGACFDNRDSRIFNYAFYETRSAARNEHIDEPVHLHQLVCALTRGIFYKIHGICGKPSFFYRRAHEMRHGFIRIYRLFAAAQYNCVARLEAEGSGIRSDIRSRFIYYADNAERHGDFFYSEPVRSCRAGEDSADEVGHRRDIVNALCHALYTLCGEGQTVYHRLEHAVFARRRYIGSVRLQYALHIFAEG